MEVKSYTFQSPYPSSVQVGREDATTSQQSEKSQDESAIQAQIDTKSLDQLNQTQNLKQPDFPERLLDIYA